MSRHYVDVTCPACDATLYDLAVVVEGRSRRATLYDPPEEPDFDVENIPTSCAECGTVFTRDEDAAITRMAMDAFHSMDTSPDPDYDERY